MYFSFGKFMFIAFSLFIIIFFILIDELVLSVSQKRYGPVNISYLGLLTSVVNGINLGISSVCFTNNFYVNELLVCIYFVVSVTFYAYQLVFPTFYLYFVFTFFFLVLLFMFDLFLLLALVIFSFSKYSFLGSLRLVSQHLALDLFFTTIVCFSLWYSFDLSVHRFTWLSSVYNYTQIDFWYFILMYIGIFWLLFVGLLWFCCGEANRVPFDLPEAESEIVAGFMTEFSGYLFSVLVLVEYLEVLLICSVIFSILNLSFANLVLMLVSMSILRTSLNRYRYDSLVSNTWAYFLSPVFVFFLSSFCLYL